MTDEFFYIELSEACARDKSKILAVAAEALTHVNGHREAAQVRQLLDKTKHETAQVDALARCCGRQGAAMNQEPQLTPAQQKLMSFLNKLATSFYSPQLMEEGYSALDEAVAENQRLQDSITTASKSLYATKKVHEL